MSLIKTEEEISHIRHSLDITTGAFSLVEQILQDSAIEGNDIYFQGELLTSEFLHAAVREYFAKHNFSLPEGLIISSGKDASEPHHPGAGPIVPGSLIVVDVFPQDNETKFFADITRTYVKGNPALKELAMYEAVWAAHQAALSALRPGIKAHEPYDTACRVLEEAGYVVTSKEEGFVHSLGHGLGIAVHEEPRLGLGSETVLEPGMVITIEPGLYYKNIGGVRIEDTVLITIDGYKQLTNVPYTFNIA